jgi:hypothetical protein
MVVQIVLQCGMKAFQPAMWESAFHKGHTKCHFIVIVIGVSFPIDFATFIPYSQSCFVY